MSTQTGFILEDGDSMIFNQDDDTPDPQPFLNPDVIRHICKFLSRKDIKNCRLVSTSWKYGSTPVLKAKSRTNLNFSPGRDENDEPLGPDLGGWDIFDVVKKLEFCPVNVRLGLRPTHECDLPLPDFSIFVPIVNNFKSIVVLYPLEEQFYWQKELFTKLILASSTTLEELQSEWLNDGEALDFPPLGGTVFPKLKTLKAGRWFESDDAIKRIGHALTTSFPNLKYLEAKCDFLVALGEDGLLPNLSRSLTSLKLGGELDTSGFECLLKIPGSLKKLVFGDYTSISCVIDDRVDRLPTIFYKLLAKHAPTLEELYIAIDWMEGEEKALEWKFPVFPVLKKLCIGDSDMIATIVFETDLESGYFGGINYPICFPVLETLYIFTSKKGSARLESFLPPLEMNDIVVESVKEVDLRISDYRRLHVMEQTRMYVRLLALFPNARDDVVMYLQSLLNLI